MPQFIPAPITFDPASTSPSVSTTLCVLEGECGRYQISGETTRIGTSPSCQLVVPSGAAFQGIIQQQEDVIWIEAVDDAVLHVNGIRCRRSLIVDGDEVVLDGHKITVTINREGATGTSSLEIPLPKSRLKPLEEDLSLLSAEELCDRLAAEHALVEEFETGLEEGWYKLLAAIEAEMELQQPSEHAAGFVGPAMEMDSSCQHILKIENATKTVELIEGETADEAVIPSVVSGQQTSKDIQPSDLEAIPAVQSEIAGQINLRASA